MKGWWLGIVGVLVVGLIALQFIPTRPATQDELAEPILSGEQRPRQVPNDWKGEPLPNHDGWRWYDPKDRGNSVRIHRGHPDAASETDRHPYVEITVKGELVDANGHLTGKHLKD